MSVRVTMKDGSVLIHPEHPTILLHNGMIEIFEVVPGGDGDSEKLAEYGYNEIRCVSRDTVEGTVIIYKHWKGKK